MIYISTGGHHQWSFDQTVRHLAEVGIDAFELSGGLYTGDVAQKLKAVASQHSITLHNYFPPPKEPFVFNLASMRQEIVDASIKHAKHVIDLSAMIGAKYYSFHAGYLIDPDVSELGQKINKRKINDRQASKALFIERVNQVSRYAADKNVKLLIENNVLSYNNYQEFKLNPLLMVDHQETEEIIANTDDNVGLLVDVAHLKVSANTLGFSAPGYLKDFKEKISAYHFSDNEGLEDSNDVVSHESWFWPYINPDLDYYSLEVYNASAQLLKQQLELTREHVNCHVKS
jgi:sugar phosphate isomerase/epimerase